jgi:hypothetical protein
LILLALTLGAQAARLLFLTFLKKQQASHLRSQQLTFLLHNNSFMQWPFQRK